MTMIEIPTSGRAHTNDALAHATDKHGQHYQFDFSGHEPLSEKLDQLVISSGRAPAA